MTRFSLDSDNLFIDKVRSYDISVWRINFYEPLFHMGEWTRVAVINPESDELELFNNVIKGPKLKQLAEELETRPWVVNRKGYMYIYFNNSSGNRIHLRLNDLFGWSKYIVNPSIDNIWNRLEIDSKKVVVDFEEVYKLVGEYKQKLEQKENELSSCKKQLEEMEKNLFGCQSDLEEKEKELAEANKSVKEKIKDLNKAKANLVVMRKELLVLTTLWEKYLGLFDGQDLDYKKLKEELLLYKEKVEKLEKELKEVNSELVIERKKVKAFHAALKCLVNYLKDLNACLGDFDFELMVPTLFDPKSIESLKGLVRGVVASKVSATVLQIVEEHNYAQ